MKFTAADRAYLKEVCNENDMSIRQIEEASKVTTYEYNKNKISTVKAIELAGRERVLSGLDRSAFHWSTAIETNDGGTIYINSSRYFK